MSINIDDNYINFLTDSEINYYYALPKFNDQQRAIYFELSQQERELVLSLKHSRSQIHFVLLLGYFKAKMLFYDFSRILPNDEDQKYVAELLGVEFDFKLNISRQLRARHIKEILELTQWEKHMPSKHRDILLDQANTLASIHPKPIFIFTEIIRKLIDNKISMPAYTELQLIVSKAITNYEKSIVKQILRIPKHQLYNIERLLSNDNDTLNIADTIALPRNLSNTEIRLDIERSDAIKNLYQFSEIWVEDHNISTETINYYSSLVPYYSRARLSNMKSPLVPLYVMCFILKRYKTINDNLSDTFHTLVSKYKNKAHSDAENAQVSDKDEFRNNEKEIAKILDLFINKADSDAQLLSVRSKAFALLEESKLNHLIGYMFNHDKQKQALTWKFIAKLLDQFKLNLRVIFKHLEINYEDNSELLEAANSFKLYLNNQVEANDLPTDFISKRMISIITTKNNDELIIDPAKYEFYLYYRVDKLITAGDISVKDSNKYLSYQSDIDSVSSTVDLSSMNLEFLSKGIKTRLDELESNLEQQIKITNDNILNGQNKTINIKNLSKNIWTLPYNRDSIDINSDTFSKLPNIDIVDLVKATDQELGFLSKFKHRLYTGAKKSLDKQTIIAVLLSRATNYGLYQMSKLSDYTHEELRKCDKAYINTESIKNACDVITNAISKLGICSEYNINNILHAEFDGQKIKTKYQTFKSRNSPKYFFLGKGMSAGTLLINHIPANAIVFGAHEHESKFVFDIVYNNETDIDAEIISTDNAGVNSINFALLDLFGKEFAPCFKEINNKESMICGFKDSDDYKELFIKPQSKIDKELIINQWPNIEATLKALAVKDSNQSTLIKKLSSNVQKVDLKRALNEYDKIVRSIYILKYIDDETLRKSVRKALNRTEAYHQLKKAVRTVGAGKNIGRNDEGVIYNDQCARLITLVIIYYNARILTEFIKDDIVKNNYISNISLVAWQHVNLHGLYKFKDFGYAIELSELIKSFHEIDDEIHL